jgi:hypothetical protein
LSLSQIVRIIDSHAFEPAWLLFAILLTDASI